VTWEYAGVTHAAPAATAGVLKLGDLRREGGGTVGGGLEEVGVGGACLLEDGELLIQVRVYQVAVKFVAVEWLAVSHGVNFNRFHPIHPQWV